MTERADCETSAQSSYMSRAELIEKRMGGFRADVPPGAEDAHSKGSAPVDSKGTGKGKGPGQQDKPDDPDG